MKLLAICVIFAASLVTVESTVNTYNNDIVCENQPMEISIAVAVSNKINSSEMPTLRTFLKELIRKFNISSDYMVGVKISIFPYAQSEYGTRADNNLKDNRQDVESRIDDLQIYDRQYYTYYKAAIDYIYKTTLAYTYTRGGVARVGIIIAHQDTTYPESHSANEARKTGITLFAIGIGNNIVQSQLHDVTGNESRIFTVDNINQLNSILNDLVQKICLVAKEYNGQDKFCENEPMEIGIVLDSSLSIREDNFLQFKQFLQRLLRKFEINSEPYGVRVSIIPFAWGIYKEIGFNLTTYNTAQQVLDAISGIAYRSGSITQTYMGIQHMHTVQMANNVVRPGVKKVGIVLTDGNSDNIHKTMNASIAARQDDIITFAIGVSTSSAHNMDEEMLYIAGDSSRYFKVNEFNMLSTILSSLANKTCTACARVPTDIIFLYSPVDLGYVSNAVAVTFINTTIHAKRMQTSFRFAVMSRICNENTAVNLSPCDHVEYITEKLNQIKEVQLKRIAKKLANDDFVVRGIATNRNRKVAVLLSNDYGLDTLTDEVQALRNKGYEVIIAYLLVESTQINIAGAEIIKCYRDSSTYNELTKGEKANILFENLYNVLRPSIG